MNSIQNNPGNPKIAFLCSSTSYGGLEMNTIKTGHWMQKRDHAVTVYATAGAPLVNLAEQKELPVQIIRRHKKYLAFRSAFRLLRQFKKDRVSVIFIRDTRDIGIAALVKFLSGNQLKIIYHQAMQIGVGKKDLFHTLRFSFIDAWMSSTRIMKENVIKNTRFPAEKIHVVPLGVETGKLLHKVPPVKEAREFFSVDPSVPLIGIMGRLNPMKGQHFLIECLEEIRKAGMDYHLLIVGEPTRHEGEEYKNKLHRLVKEKKLEHCVHFHGFLREINWFFSAIDIFALASEKETYGMVTVEALVFGVPVIASNSGGTPEILNHGKYGKLYQPRDPKDFIEKFKKLDQQKEKATFLKEIRTLYSHTRQCELMEEIIEKICT